MMFTLVKSKGCLLPIRVHLFANTAGAFTSIGFTFFMTDVSAATTNILIHRPEGYFDVAITEVMPYSCA